MENIQQISLSYSEVAYLLSEPAHTHKAIFESYFEERQDETISTLTVFELSNLYPKVRCVDPRMDGKSRIELHLSDVKKLIVKKEINKRSNVVRGALSGIAKKIAERFLSEIEVSEINKSLSDKKEYVKLYEPVKRKVSKKVG